MSQIRPLAGFRTYLKASDAAAIEACVRRTGVFRPDEISVAMELVNDRLERGEKSDYLFIIAEVDDAGTGMPELAGFSCYGRIPCTVSGFDLYWIAVEPRLQGRGIGRAILDLTESLIAKAGGRRLYAETSSQESYAPTRSFYEKNGFKRLALIEDFYAPGDGKVIYGKEIAKKTNLKVLHRPALVIRLQ